MKIKLEIALIILGYNTALNSLYHGSLIIEYAYYITVVNLSHYDIDMHIAKMG